MTAISGLTLLAFGKKDLFPTTVPVPNTLDVHHHLMWVLIIIAMLLLLFMALYSGTPTTPSGMGRTATLGATAVLIHDYHGFGGHSNKETNNDITVRWCTTRTLLLEKIGTEVLGNLHPLTHVVLTHTCTRHQYSTHTSSH